MHGMLDSDFDAIVGDFYRAATCAMTWDAALDRLQVAFGARAALLHTADLRTGQLLALHTGGPARDDASLDYVRDYHRIDPRRELLLRSMPQVADQWWHCHEHVDATVVERSPFYRDFMSAYDARYMSTVLLLPRDGVFTAFALELPASRGFLTMEEREIARRLGDHLAEALRAYERTRALLRQALVGHKLLDAFPYPMWLIGEDRAISFGNLAASNEEADERRIARRGMNLVLINQRAERSLTERLHQLCRNQHGATAAIDLRATAADAPTWLHLAALQPGAALGAFGEQPQILATLFDPQHVSALDPFALGSLFGLTPAEARIAVGLAEGLTAGRLALVHGVAVATVRSQIAQVISKLGAARTVDVVRMLRQGEALWSRAGEASVGSTG